MAPIVTHKDRSKDLITHVCTGQISVDEILTAAQEYFSGEVTKHVLWDFAEAEVDIRQPQIDKLMIYLRGLPPDELEKRRGGRVAIVAPKEYVVGVMVSSRDGLRWWMLRFCFRCSTMQKKLWPGSKDPGN